ncbi:MAG TPA: GAF and ANTAR domain-containing protein [Actinomycetales bacterium]|jgi:transcriptional regulator with GAF, ATPase, and Fis domain|nr:GAF and ANTAR domain-containing protein [Actinomycetales bacterium]
MPHIQRLAEVFVELADTLIDNFDVVDFLQTLTERCVELLEADASGLMLTDQRGGLQVIAATLDRARALELFELQVQEGPCLESFTTGEAITNVELTEAEALTRWPVFAPAAVEAGFRTTHALPMRLRGRVLGALNLFNDRQVHLEQTDLAVGQALADVATIGLLHQRTTHEQSVLAEQLQHALHSRILVEQAKGALAASAGINVNEAFTRMRAHARANNLTLTTVATSVVDGSISRDALVPR